MTSKKSNPDEFTVFLQPGDIVMHENASYFILNHGYITDTRSTMLEAEHMKFICFRFLTKDSENYDRAIVTFFEESYIIRAGKKLLPKKSAS